MSGASPTEDVVAEAGDLPAEPNRRLGKRRIAVIAAIAVLVLAGIGTAVFFLTKGDDKPPSQGDNQNGGAAATAPAGNTGRAAPGTPPPPPTGADAAEAGTVRQVAEKAIQTFNAHDAAGMKKLSCNPDGVPAVDTIPPEASVELAANPELTGDTATVELTLTIGDNSTSTPLPLRKVNGAWCLD